jgi:hypothetical protein
VGSQRPNFPVLHKSRGWVTLRAVRVEEPVARTPSQAATKWARNARWASLPWGAWNARRGGLSVLAEARLAVWRIPGKPILRTK